MKIGSKLFFWLLVFFLANEYAFALVDYSTDTPTSTFTPETPTERVKKRGVRPNTPSNNRPTGEKSINFTTRFGQQNINTPYLDSEYSLIDLEGHFQTPYNIFLDARYWMAQSDNRQLVSDTSYQEGNPEVKIGFNWLKLGTTLEAMAVDLYAGGSFRSSKSDFASSRNDKKVGLQTIKRFESQFMFGFGLEYIMTGRPDDLKELEIGNIQKFTAALGWSATDDIRFSLEAVAGKVLQSKNRNDSIGLSEAFSYSTVSPRLHLLLHSFYNLELGGTFLTRRPGAKENILKAKLFSEKGLYGNSIYAGINILM